MKKIIFPNKILSKTLVLLFKYISLGFILYFYYYSLWNWSKWNKREWFNFKYNMYFWFYWFQKWKQKKTFINYVHKLFDCSKTCLFFNMVFWNSTLSNTERSSVWAQSYVHRYYRYWCFIICSTNSSLSSTNFIAHDDDNVAGKNRQIHVNGSLAWCVRIYIIMIISRRSRMTWIIIIIMVLIIIKV